MQMSVHGEVAYMTQQYGIRSDLVCIHQRMGPDIFRKPFVDRSYPWLRTNDAYLNTDDYVDM